MSPSLGCPLKLPLGPGDRLLYVLSEESRRGSIAWIRFRQWVREAVPPAQEHENWAVRDARTALDALGHCEFDFAGDEVWVAPPVLAQLPQRPSAAVLCGFRVPWALQWLATVAEEYGARVSIDRQPSVLAPACWRVDAESPQLLRRVADQLGVQLQCSASDLVRLAPSLKAVLDALTWDQSDLPVRRREFDPQRMDFVDEQPEGLTRRLIEVDHLPRKHHYLQQAGESKAARVDRDWGRFAVLRAKRRVVCRYAGGKLLVNPRAPLPKLIARGLTLCTGLMPRRERQGLAYACVPADLATASLWRLAQNDSRRSEGIAP